jgi:hypothetical protein
MDLTFVGKKSRDIDHPYATLTGIMFGGEAEYRILKKNTKFCETQYASLFVAAQTPATFGGFDMGDTYVSELVNLSLASVEGRTPTESELDEWAQLRGHHRGSGGLVYTMDEIAASR